MLVPKRVVPDALALFETNLERETQAELITFFIENRSTEHFKLPEGVARILAACDYYRSNSLKKAERGADLKTAI